MGIAAQTCAAIPMRYHGNFLMDQMTRLIYIRAISISFSRFVICMVRS
jgi:hypothetical protein